MHLVRLSRDVLRRWDAVQEVPQLGTDKTVKARFWPLLEPFSGKTPGKRFKLTPLCSEADLVGLSLDVLGRRDSVQELRYERLYKCINERLYKRATLQTSDFTKYAPGQAESGRPEEVGRRARSPRSAGGSMQGQNLALTVLHVP